MPLPQLDPEQRRAALEKAAAARRARADLKQELKSGSIDIREVFARADGSEPIAKMRVSDVLEALPSYGKVKARKLMERVDISPSRRLRGLGSKQRAALLEEFGA